MRYSWNNITREELNPQFVRRAIHSGRMTVARLELAKGGVVPHHSHENEQITMLESGRLRFDFPDESVELSAGDVLVIPPHRPHSVAVLEDSVAVDVFAPLREDWLTGNDDYLRRR